MTRLSRVAIAVAAGSQPLIDPFASRVSALAPGAVPIVVSEFPPSHGAWVPYRLERSVEENLARVLAEIAGREIDLCAVLEEPGTPHQPLRELADRLDAGRVVIFNPELRSYVRKPASAWDSLRYARWRFRNFARRQVEPGGGVYGLARLLRGPASMRRPLLYRLARSRKLDSRPRSEAPALETPPAGVSVVIPSRNGQELLRQCLPPLLAQSPDQVIVVDNGSTDGSADWLRANFPEVAVVCSAAPLSFAAAINAGLARASFAHLCLLNNDMEVEPGFLDALSGALREEPELFCATAQIFFPAGRRREETGKAVMPPGAGPFDFPITCILPVEGESRSPVLYGSGGCSMYDTAKLRALGGLDKSFTPAYVEDLDIGFRGWQHGWPTVFVPEARVLHRHRSTTSRYFSEAEIQSAVEKNYLRFLLKNVSGPFDRLWSHAVDRVNLLAATDRSPAKYFDALGFAGRIRAARPPSPQAISDEDVLALGSGEVTRFAGRQRSAGPRVTIASCYAPFPLSHGGAVRMYNLMRRGAADFQQTLVYFVDEPAAPPEELREICGEIIQIRRQHSHAYGRTDLPDVVQDFASPAMAAILRRRKADILQLEFTQLAQYAGCCAGAKTILVEHDVTIDLYAQLKESASGGNRWELERQLALWDRFERQAWRQCDRVAAMSERDRAVIGDRAVVLANGVDTERYRPAAEAPERGRLLFIGSFAHLPNLMALEFFVNRVLPHVPESRLHVIAGSRPGYYLDYYRDRVSVNLNQPGIELEAFVSDVRPAYRRAQIVIAPLVASAGTNIKILEAMAMGRPVVSAPAGVNGLDLAPDRDFLLAGSAEEMAAAVRSLIADPGRCEQLAANAWQTVRERYDWDRIAERQREIYETLLAEIA